MRPDSNHAVKIDNGDNSEELRLTVMTVMRVTVRKTR